MSISFFIPHTVTAKQSMRVSAGLTRDGKPFTRRYKPKDVAANERTLASLIAPHRPKKPLTGPLRAVYTFQYGWRKSETKRNRVKGWLAKDTKPDCDNLSKQVSDVLESMGFFADDAQIAELIVRKCWGDGDVGVWITLEQWDHENYPTPQEAGK